MKNAPKNISLLLMTVVCLLFTTVMFSANTPPPPPTPDPPGLPIDQNILILILVAVVFGCYSLVKNPKKQI
ncbi:MAG: hypothetical protein KBC56_09575 [Flavobacterium sp.]|nr:hypothetical protein [Flavobacterium sp.]